MIEVADAEKSPSAKIKQRLISGVPGFEQVLQGGLLSGATHLIVGVSGAGKTILSQQIAFQQAKSGASVLCLTLLSESHEKMLSNLAELSFFDVSLVSNQIQYLSLYNEVEREGAKGFVVAGRRAVLKHKAQLVIVDGVSSLRDFAQNKQEFRKILFDFNTQLSALGCTVLLLVDDELAPEKAPEYAIADSIVKLHNVTYRQRHVRSLEVLKSRAVAALTGVHSFDITHQGITVYPRLEALLHKQRNLPPPALTGARHAVGVEGLDNMLSGGFFQGSVNMLLGTPGTGKSLIGLRFIYEGACRGERGLVLSLQHSEADVRAITKALGFDLGRWLDEGTVKFLWVLPLERHLDEVMNQLWQTIEDFKPRRLLIDSLSELEALSTQPEHLTDLWVAFTNYLRNQQVTTLAPMAYKQIVGNNLVMPEHPISLLVDSLLFIRTLEYRAILKRYVCILHMRNTGYDSAVREFSINSDKGLEVGEPFSGTQGVLTGLPQAL